MGQQDRLERIEERHAQLERQVEQIRREMGELRDLVNRALRRQDEEPARRVS